MSEKKFREINDYFLLETRMDEFMVFIQEISAETVFVIMSVSEGTYMSTIIVPLI